MIKITACLYDLEMTEWKNWFGQVKNAWSNRGTEFTVRLGDSTETWLGIAHLQEQMDEGLKHDHLEMLRCHWKPRGHERKTSPGGASGKQGVMKAKPRRPMLSSYLRLPTMRKNPHQIDQIRSVAQSFATPWISACQASLSIINSRSSLRLISIESVMPSSHLILCCPLLETNKILWSNYNKN